MESRVTRVVLAALLLGLLAGACGKENGVMPGNQPPVTYLSIVSPTGAPLDTTDYRKILNWWGTDPDGTVRGYLIRWDGPWTPPPGTARVYEGSTYSFTTATADTFRVPLADSIATRTFTVRAVDDRDLVDPVGVTQAFILSDHKPQLKWGSQIPLPTTTLPAAAFGVSAVDFDGRDTVHEFRIWLDADSADARVVPDSIFALRPEDFHGQLDQDHTIHVRAYDDAQAASNTLSHTWHVVSPAGQWLLIDQITGAGSDTNDRPFFHAVLDSVTGGSYHVIHMDHANDPDFGTPIVIEPLFSIFKGVIWVTGPYNDRNDKKMAANLAITEDAIRTYVESGGRMVLMGQNVLGTGGGLSNGFAAEVLGIGSFFQVLLIDGVTRVTNLPLSINNEVQYVRDGVADSLRVTTTAVNVEFFPAPTAPGSGAYWVRPGILPGNSLPPQTEPAYLGVVATPGSGRIGVVTASYARLFDYVHHPDQIGEAVRFFRAVLLP